MESMIHTQTLSDDLVHQRDNLKEAVSIANQQDTDMVIVSKDKTLIPCHSSLLALFSPAIARLLSGVLCCSPPTIFLPDFPTLPIKKLLHLLKSGQAIPGKNENIDIKMIKEVADVLQISIIDLNLGPWLDNPLGVPFEIKKELSSFNVKTEINSFEGEKKVINVKQESESYNEEIEVQAMPVKLAEKEQNEYIEQVAWMTPVNFNKTAKSQVNSTPIKKPISFSDMGLIHSPKKHKTILGKSDSERKTNGPVIGIGGNGGNNFDEGIVHAAEKDQNDEVISTVKEPKVIIESSDDLIIKEAAQVLFENEQMSHSWYEQTEENVIVGSIMSYYKKNNIIPDVEQDLADQTKSSEDKSQLRKHKKSHMDEKQFPSSACSKITSQIGPSNKMKKIHKEEQLKSNLTGGKPYQCLFSSEKNSLQTKMNRHKFYQCAMCSKSFSSMGRFKRHKFVHTGEKPHRCDLCPKSFSLIYDLKEHKMIHTGEKPYQCHFCSKSFKSMHGLKQHKMTHTGEKPH